MTLEELLDENRRRNEKWNVAPYDPIVGNPADEGRKEVYVPVIDARRRLPLDMLADPEYAAIDSVEAYRNLRMCHDFEYWAAMCVTIRHKVSGRLVPFVLNAPQRRALALLEEDRRAGNPLRMIMLKARQWGGSTVVQIYFAWIQIIHRRNWNSLICAHLKDTACAIRAMYDRLVNCYPPELWQEDEAPRLKVWQRSQNSHEIAGRGSTVTISSSCGQDSSRGLDYAMVHMSEVAYWYATDRRNPMDFARAICGSVPLEPYSAIVMESTANGVGNFFHTQWLKAERGETSYRPIFVPWYEIEIYRKECPDPMKLFESLTPYERDLWDNGLTLEMLQWYHTKRKEFPSDQAMFAEYPTTAQEAFENSGRNVFDSQSIESVRKNCCDPLDLSRASVPASASQLLDSPAGDGVLKVWRLPEELSEKSRYVAVVDVGARWIFGDWSVITVFDRRPSDDPEAEAEVVAQWRGHCDHDLLANYAETVARAYANALLVVESNSLESSSDPHTQYILEELHNRYRNMYVRSYRDSSGKTLRDSRVGFHTNRATKAAAITNMISAVRRATFIERDHSACDEMATYELLDSGGYAARTGYHDDMLITRAIGLYIINHLLGPKSDTPRQSSLDDFFGRYNNMR
ncbi:MAG: hypothetical protein NC111_04320 [Bacteroides sp.]|nr:hypothetical protein [Bacteroides sp.]MCM1413029.1 hypothetical protein [Bacteroides sp.]MCM1471735.1 hypothetical protein [Bacteroides sp.]